MGSTLADAVRASPEPDPAATLLDLAANPGARQTMFPDGFDPWRGRVGIRVSAPPLDGKANRAIVAAVATFFGLGTSEVTVVRGEHSAQKTLRLAGVDARDALARLESALERP